MGSLLMGYLIANTIASDKSVFISEEFAQFAKQNGVEHIRTSPYHPVPYGLAKGWFKCLRWV